MISNEIKAALTVIYEGITIEYLENTSVWRFELRGRERKADSLKQAKEWIDKPEPKAKKAKTFERIEVFLFDDHGRGNKRQMVTVTSAATDHYDRDKSSPSQAWVLLPTGERCKEWTNRLFLITEDNAAKWDKYDQLVKQKLELNTAIEKVYASLEKLDLKAYLTAEESTAS